MPDTPSNRRRLTKSVMAELRCPPDRLRAYTYDTEVDGLAVAAYPTGRQSFYLVKKQNGRTRFLKLGDPRTMSVAEARKRARDLIGQVARGDDLDRQIRRGGMTLGQLFEDWLEGHAKPRKKTWAWDEANFNHHLDRWRDRRISTITQQDVRKLHNDIGAEAQVMANRILTLLRTLFNWVIAEHQWSRANPTAGIRKFPEESRERYLSRDEMGRFFAALSEEPNTTMRDFFIACLLTGQRRRTVAAMRWDNIDLDSQLWRIPDSKTGGLVVVLSPQAVTFLRGRRAVCNGSLFVFPGQGASGHIEEPRPAWKRVLERSGISNLRMHDLRRTLGSWMASDGSSLHIIGSALGHKDESATRVYARLDYDPVRQAISNATDRMLEAANGKGGE